MNRKIGVIMSYIAMIFEVLSTLLLTPFILRTIGQAEFGVFKLTAAIVSYLLLLDLGVGNSVIRYMSKYRTNNDKRKSGEFLGIATIFYLIIAIITIILGVVFHMVFPHAFAKGLTAEEVILGQRLLFVNVLNAAITLGTAGFANAVIAYQYFAFQKGCLIIQIILKIVLTYIGLALGYGSLSIVIVQLFTTILCRLAYVIFVFAKIKLIPKFKGIEKEFIREVVVYSSFILLQMIATQINSCADQILLGSFVVGSSLIIGIYGVGSQVATYFQSIGNSMSGVLMPGIVSFIESGPDTEKLLKEMVRISRLILEVLIIIWVGFIIFGQQFIILWAGSENCDAYIVALILMSAHMLILTESVGTQILWAMNEHKEQSILKICVVVLNIILTIVLIKWDALIGATIGTFISLMLGDVLVMNVVFIRKIQINICNYYRGLFKGVLPVVFITGIIGYFLRFVGLRGWFGFIVNIIFILCIYIILMWRYGFNLYEKNLVRSILRKIIRYC